MNRRTLYFRYIPLVFVAVVYAGTFLVLLPIIFRERVFSSYFALNNNSEIEKRVLHQNSLRLAGAKAYLNNIVIDDAGVDSNNDRFAKQSERNNDVIVVIITSQRPIEVKENMELGYLTQVATAFQRLSLIEETFGKIDVFICNVDIQGVKYTEAFRLSNLLHTIVKFTNDNTIPYYTTMDKFEKEKRDYQFCLNASLAHSHAPSVVVVEDDALPKEYFFKALSQILNKHSLYGYRPKRSSDIQSDLGFIKLYYPEKWAGYGNELLHFYELFQVGVTGMGVSNLLWFTYIRLMCRNRRSWSRTSIIVASLLGCVFFISLVYTIGRPYVMGYLGDHFHWYSLREAKNCCTPAVYYHSRSLTGLVNYLETVTCTAYYSIDQALDDYADTRKLKRYLVEPNLVTHIGMYSSFRRKNVAEFLDWS